MSFLQGYTAAAAGIAAMEATHARALLAAQHQLLATQHAQEQHLAALRQETFAFANLFRQAREGGRYLAQPAHGVFEAQRLVNWMALNVVSAAAFPAYQDKAFLVATCEEADRATQAGVHALGSRRAGAVQRLAVLEDLAPYLAEYETWRTVRATLRRWTPLVFHGLPSLFTAFLLVAGALLLATVHGGLTASSPESVIAKVTGVLVSLICLAAVALALVGPFLRKALVAGLRRRVGVHGGWIGSRITTARAADILAGIRARMAVLDPGLAPGRPRELLDEERLAALRAEPARLQAVVAAG